MSALGAHVYELSRHALFADRGVQRRGEGGKKNHVLSVQRGGAGKALENFKEAVGEHGDAVEVRQAVAVEPAGVPQGLARQFFRGNVHGYGAGADLGLILFAQETDGHGVLAGSADLLRLVDGDPHALEALGQRGKYPCDAFLMIEMMPCAGQQGQLRHGGTRIEDIGIKSRCGRVVQSVKHGVKHGNIADAVHIDGKIAFHAQKHGSSLFVAVDELEGKRFVGQCGKSSRRFRGAMVGEKTVQRT